VACPAEPERLQSLRARAFRHGIGNVIDGCAAWPMAIVEITLLLTCRSPRAVLVLEGRRRCACRRPTARRHGQFADRNGRDLEKSSVRNT